jgi:Transcription factor WhiB
MTASVTIAPAHPVVPSRVVRPVYATGFNDRGESTDTLLEMLARTGRPAWWRDAACREHPAISWCPERGESCVEAKRVCQRCLVQRECLAWSLARPEALCGIFGGWSRRQRLQARRG